MSAINNKDADLRSQAVERLKKRSDLWSHLAAYLLVNSVLVIVWFATGAEFFWPVFPLAIWGIGLIFHAMDVFRRPISEERIRREMERML